MTLRLLVYILGPTIALLLFCTESTAQCGYSINENTVQCNSPSGVKQIPSYSCQLYGNYRAGSPGQYCSENVAYCQQVNGTEVE